MDNPLLSYIDVKHANFLSPFLIVGKAPDLGPIYTTIEDRALVWDESTEHISQSHKVHVPVEVLNAPAQVVEPRAAEADQDAAMVTR